MAITALKLGKEGPNRRLTYEGGRLVGVEIVDIDAAENDKEAALFALLGSATYGIGRPWSANMQALVVAAYDIQPLAGTAKWRGEVRYEFSAGGDTIRISHGLAAGTITTDRDAAGTQFPYKRTANVYVPEKTMTYERTETDWGYLDNGELWDWNHTTTAGVAPWNAAGRYSWGRGAMGTAGENGSQHQRTLSLQSKVNSDTFLNTTADVDWLFMGADVEQLPEPYPHAIGAYTVYLTKWRVSYHFAYKPYRSDGWSFRHPDTGNLYSIYESGNFGALDLRWPGGAAL